MKKNLRRAGFVSLTLGALGCGEPSSSVPANPQELFRTGTTTSDSLQGQAWRKYLGAMELHRAWAPGTDSPWRAFYKPTLIAAIATVQSAAMPVRTPLMTPAEAEAQRFVTTVNLKDTAVFVDLPGEESVLWGAALHAQGQLPVLTINNWPHPAGLLRLERPLGALLYYAAQVAAAPLPKDARPAFLLERSRLGQKGLNPSSSQFDNRYFHVLTDFPSAEVLKSRGIRQIVYVNPQSIFPGAESDDLSDYFVQLSQAGMQFSYVKPGRETFEMAVAVPKPRETIFTKQDVETYARSSSYHSHYYHSYSHYSYWHSSYWSRSSGAWGSSSGSSHGYSS